MDNASREFFTEDGTRYVHGDVVDYYVAMRHILYRGLTAIRDVSVEGGVVRALADKTIADAVALPTHRDDD